MIRIFLVDDDALVRDKLREFLQQRTEWVVVGEACNGRLAVETFGQHMPHVVVMDFQMPEMNGLEAARHLSAKYEDVRILLVTLYLSKQLEEEARKVGIKGACSKLQIQCVVNAIETLLTGGTYFQQSAA